MHENLGCSMFFPTTEERIKKMEKRIGEIERQMNRSLESMNEALLTMTDIISKLNDENGKFKKEGQMLSSSQKKVEKEIRDIGVKKEIKENVVEPVKAAIKENMNFVQEVAYEGLPTMNSLARLVEAQGEIRLQDAASRLRVHELQAEKWATQLKEQKIVAITDKNKKRYLSYIKPAKK